MMPTANCSSKAQENTEKKTVTTERMYVYFTSAPRYEFTLLLLLNRGNSLESMRGSVVCLPISYFPINYHLCTDFVIMSS